MIILLTKSLLAVTEQFFDQSGLDILSDYDTETILSYPQLVDWCIDHHDFDVTDERVVYMTDTPNSTAIKAIGYSPIWKILVVVFRNSNDMYYYYDVPEDVGFFYDWTDTLGEDFNEYIKGSYDYELICDYSEVR